MKMSFDLVVCFVSLVIFFGELIYFLVRISIEKKRAKNEGKKIIKPGAAYIGSIVLCFLTISLPILIPLKTMVIIIVCLCGILGNFVVFNDRIKNLCE